MTDRSPATSRLFVPAQDTELTALRGFCAAHAETIALHEEPLFVHSRATAPGRTVGIVSGGGTGHEPMHAGIVGAGGLDAAVPGKIFASPHNGQVYAASRRVAREGGVLHIVKNYTGDRIHFGIAAERLADDGIAVARVLVDDDCATDSDETATGRRGTGATIIVEKVLGALADRGASLHELESAGNALVAESRSLAVASGPLTSFATGRPGFEVAEGTLEYGIGIHGEPAPETIDQPPLDELVSRMAASLLAGLPEGTDRVIALVNGLGAVTALELAAILDLLATSLEQRGVTIDSALAGTYVSALDMRGFSITLTRTDDERTALWLAPADVPGLPTTSRFHRGSTPPGAGETTADAGTDPLLERTARLVDDAHGDLTRLDQLAGDGDFGDNLRDGVRTALRLPGTSGLERLTASFLDHVGGSSGPLIGLLLAAVHDATAGVPAGAEDLAARLREGVREGMAAISRAGGARPGDRTMLDALHGLVDSPADDVVGLVRAAADGALATRDIAARQGRASYVGARVVGAPDAGAVGVVVLLAALVAELAPGREDEAVAVVAELLRAAAPAGD